MTYKKSTLNCFWILVHNTNPIDFGFYFQMSINAYIDSLTKITPKKSVENVRWAKVSEGNKKKETKQRVPQGRGVSPYLVSIIFYFILSRTEINRTN